MASMTNRSMSAVSDLGLVQPTDLGAGLVNETEEQKKKRLAKMKETPTAIISPAVQALLGTGAFHA